MAELLENPVVQEAYKTACKASGVDVVVPELQDLPAQGARIGAVVKQSGLLDLAGDWERAQKDGPIAILETAFTAGAQAASALKELSSSFTESSDMKKVVSFILNGLVRNESGVPEFEYRQQLEAGQEESRTVALPHAISQHPLSERRGMGFATKATAVVLGMTAVPQAIEAITADETRVRYQNTAPDGLVIEIGESNA